VNFYLSFHCFSAGVYILFHSLNIVFIASLQSPFVLCDPRALPRTCFNRKMFKTLNTEGASASSTSEGEGQLVLGLEGEVGVNLSFLLESEKTGGESLQLAVAGESVASFLDSYHHHLFLMMASPASASRKLSPPVFSLPNKKLKMTPPSPPNPSADCPPPAGVEEADSPSVFNVLNIFRQRWFLNRDHLIANILSTQKDECSKLFWVDFQPQFHTHLVHRALTLLPALCPVDLGNRCMFVFLLEVLDNNGPGPYRSGSFFSLEKKSGRSHGPRRKPGPSGPPPPSQPPLPPLDHKIWQPVPVQKKTPVAPPPPAPVVDLLPPAWASSPFSAPSPLSPLPLFQGAGPSHVSPEFVVSRTPTPRPSPVPLVPLNPLPSPVTLSQVEDVIATSNMVWELNFRHLPSSPLSAPSSPPMFGDMEWAADPYPSSQESSEASFNLWVPFHPAPTSGSPLQWRTWFDEALCNEVPKEGLTEFIKALSFAQPAMIRDKFVQNRLSALADAVHVFKASPVSGT
jgi:hypothetical protein